MIVCSKCGNQAQDGALFCDQCGNRLVMDAAAPATEAAPAPGMAAPVQDSVTCPSCGFSNVPGEAFCENCGTQLAAPEPLAPSAPATADSLAPQAEGAGGVVCPGCGALAAQGDEFCYACGADLKSAATIPAPAPEAEPAVALEPGSCPFCGAPDQAGEDYCGYCGAALTGAPVTGEQAAAPVTEAPAVDLSVAGAPRLVVAASGAEIPLPSQAEVVVGREDPVSNVFPHVDLTPHGGEEGGVSRQHFKILAQGDQFSIEDLNSTNYTLVNKKRLDPGVAQSLNDGDEIRAGRVRLVFKVS